MDQNVRTFLDRNRVGALSLPIGENILHSAALHYSYQTEPFEIYFSTDITSRKCRLLKETTQQPASLVIGLSEEDWDTLQLEGTVQLITDKAIINQVKAIHYPKHPNSQKFESDPNTVFLVFRPTWWRYTDFKIKPPLKIEHT
jgi:general stress protein 26